MDEKGTPVSVSFLLTQQEFTEKSLSRFKIDCIRKNREEKISEYEDLRKNIGIIMIVIGFLIMLFDFIALISIIPPTSSEYLFRTPPLFYIFLILAGTGLTFKGNALIATIGQRIRIKIKNELVSQTAWMVDISDHYLSVKTASRQESYELSRLKEAIAGDLTFILVVDEETVVQIPKRCLTQAQTEEITRILREKCPLFFDANLYSRQTKKAKKN